MLRREVLRKYTNVLNFVIMIKAPLLREILEPFRIISGILLSDYMNVFYR